MTVSPLLVGALMAAAKTSKTTTTNGGASTLIFYAVIAVAGYFLWRSFSRNKRLQAQRQQDLTKDLHPGEEIMTTHGIFGTVLDSYDDRVTIETAPGTRMTIHRSAIGRRIQPEDTLGEVTDEDLQDLHGEADPQGTEHEGDPGHDGEPGHDGLPHDHTEPGPEAPGGEGGTT